MPNTIVFPSDMLNPRVVDEFFKPEFDVVKELGGTILLSSPDERIKVRKVNGELADNSTVIYRGWMPSVSEYAQISRNLRDFAGLELINTEETRKEAHFLPGWYGKFENLTPVSIWFEGDGTDVDYGKVQEVLGAGPYVVKDYVKSRKHEWDTACFAKDFGSLSSIVNEFVRLQESSLAGGIIVRKYEDFDPETGEIRVWWVDGQVIASTSHTEGVDIVADWHLDGLREAVESLNARFVTTDLAKRSVGAWRVVEVGDGQVSGIIDSDRLKDMYEGLLYR